MRTAEEINNDLKEKDKQYKQRQLRDLFNNGHITIEEYTQNTIVEDDDPLLADNKTEINIKLSDLINPNFNRLFSTKDPIRQPYRVFKGGRSSFKSSTVSIKLVHKFLQDDKSNIIGFRKVAKYLSTSIYEQIKWAIILLNTQHEFTFLKSPLKIIHKRTNTAFYFYGVDDPLKIKSAKISEGYVSDLWYEEAAEFDGKQEIEMVNDTFIREDLPGDQQVEIYFTYNPPRNPYTWINEWLDEIKYDEDYYVHHSSYEEDQRGFLSEQFKKKVAKIKKTDPDYHDWMYGGKVIGLGDVIYNYSLFKIVDDVPDDDRILFGDITIDPGYSTSATTFLFIGYTMKKRAIVLDTFYYSPRSKVTKKAPSEFSNDLWEFAQDNMKKFKISIDTWTIDSAEGALRNQFFKDKGVYLAPAKKKKKVKMIENVEDLLAREKLYVLDTENNEVFLDEHKKYQWDEDTLQSDDPKVIKVYDHTCDALQYFVTNNLNKLEMKV